MRIIKVSAIDSTNDFAKDLYRNKSAAENICVVAESQLKGRGQRGSGWISNTGENLTMSLLIPNLHLPVADRFCLSAVISLAVLDALKEKELPKLKVKWPNDIMSANFKIGGILIENFLKDDRITAAVIGLGLNVNQLVFDGLPQAGSLRSQSKKSFDLDILLDEILKCIEIALKKLDNPNSTRILKEYEEQLFKRNVVATFQLPAGEQFSGIIKGVTNTGLLKVQNESEEILNFDLKEVKLLY